MTVNAVFSLIAYYNVRNNFSIITDEIICAYSHYFIIHTTSFKTRVNKLPYAGFILLEIVITYLFWVCRSVSGTR